MNALDSIDAPDYTVDQPAGRLICIASVVYTVYALVGWENTREIRSLLAQLSAALLSILYQRVVPSNASRERYDARIGN